MSLLAATDLSLAFGKKTIVSGLNLRIADGERIGLIGPNGSGKSTLLKILAGQQHGDGGEIARAKGVRIGYLPQDLALAGGQSLEDFVVSSVPGRDELDDALRAAETALEACTDEDEMMALATEVAELHERIGHFDTLYTEHEAKQILAGLGFSAADFERDLGEFSGGWKMRAVLSGLLFQQPDLLLLDEPTNHLDMPSVAWLSSFLKRYKRSFVLICHDREFLNEQIDRVISFEVEGVRQYRGNYERYLKQRAEEETVLENKAKNLAREREKAEQFIDRFRAQANKAKAVQSRVKALERMEHAETFKKREVMRITFPPTGRTSNEVIRIRGLSKSYGSNPVLDDVDLNVSRGDKIGIIGVNGAGKTTLLRLIASELERDNGEIRFGAHVKLNYYAQHHSETLDRSSTVLEEVSRADPASGQTRVRSVLGAFLFQGDDVDKPVTVLSGGERARVALARMLVAPGNLLLMDEPTNHLDLASSEALAESLADFDGTLVFVSHNRAFVRKLATKIWNVESGRVEPYPGTLDEYLAHAQAERGGESGPQGRRGKAATGGKGGNAGASESKPSAAPRLALEKTKTSRTSKDDARAQKGSAKERRREQAERRAARQKKVGPLEKKVAQLEAAIERLEAEQKQRNVALADPAVFQDPSRRNVLLDEYQRDAELLEDKTSRWEVAQAELEALLEQLEPE